MFGPVAFPTRRPLFPLRDRAPGWSWITGLTDADGQGLRIGRTDDIADLQGPESRQVPRHSDVDVSPPGRLSLTTRFSRSMASIVALTVTGRDSPTADCSRRAWDPPDPTALPSCSLLSLCANAATGWRVRLIRTRPASFGVRATRRACCACRATSRPSRGAGSRPRPRPTRARGCRRDGARRGTARRP